MGNHRVAMDVTELVAEHHKAVFGYAFRLVGSVADAEDLTQQVFLAAHQKIDQLREPEAARAWLFAILRNCVLKDRRRRRPLVLAESELNIENIPADTPGREALDTERLQRALDQLSPQYRLVLVMFYYEECSYREIAEKLDVPMGTVMSRLARAKGQLRAILFETAPTR